MRNSLLRLFVSLFLVSAFSVSPAQAQSTCANLFEFAQRPEVRALVQPDAYKQWLLWEQKSNFEPFQKGTEPVMLPANWVSRFAMTVEFSQAAPAELKKNLVSLNYVLWTRHPWNTSDQVPFFDLPPTGNIPAYLTASRSMVFADPKLRGFSIKLPTDRPHGPKGEHQPSKVDTSDDVLVAILHSDHIYRQDQKIGTDPNLIILPEAATISDPKTRVGVVIRDVRRLDDGNYYLPALSIPYVGRQIAQLHGQKFESFWEKNYAELLGEAKAKLLLRYGLQMETPNAQNMLVQLDRNLRPTGKLVFRDLSDAVFVDGITQNLGFQKELEQDIQVDYKPHTYLKPFWSNSSWRFNEAGGLSVSNEALQSWGIAHNRAYVETLARELGFNPDQVGIRFHKTNQDSTKDVYHFLTSPQGQELIRKYRERLTSPYGKTGFYIEKSGEERYLAA